MIELVHLSKKYSRLKAVDDFSLTIGPHRIIGLLGPNGAGKTTIMKMMAGMIRPSSGEIIINGMSLATDNIYKNRLRIGYAPEEIILYKKLKGREFLEFICSIYKVENSVAAMNKYVELFMLEDKMDKLIEEYSHGMMRKMSLIAALIHEPDILILDEPTTGLDPKAIKIVKDILYLQKNNNKTIFFSTHILDIAEYLCDELAIIDKGKLLFIGSIENLRKHGDLPNANLEELFLEMTKKSQ